MAFTELVTDRLLLRPVLPSDAASLVERRNDPEVARFQNWTSPYSLEQADALIAETMQLDGPTDGEWYTMTVADRADRAVLGDVVVYLSSAGRTAEIGYTLAREYWGRGYATEAAAALVEYLFESLAVTRVTASLHPDNQSSAMVLERVGMLFEGHTRSSFWLGEDNSDDWIYGMLRADWDAWRTRPRGRPGVVALTEITPDTVRTVGAIRGHRSQERFVAPVPVSFGDAMFPEIVDGRPLEPWMRAIDADGTLAGFVMVACSTDAHPEPYLWRLLVDRMHQRRGVGGTAVDLVIEQCRAWGDRALRVSWVPGRGSPGPLYLARGFVPTGEIIDGEIEARLVLG
ncbi:MAG TPA: GNAT family N-acetyltransferase [Ilumatobacteraceae bacterium]|nr:GNAT family N-acetyltransferase [Ilumatobacteraceae bacterium]